ncbi:hypothetical protein F5Y16DRAFT_384618 [Xylariaceae sp. FL0255]|nr:hypothetical protein F5Y16DRAFT_384618 [Xylariaceae sp. FL0255]
MLSRGTFPSPLIITTSATQVSLLPRVTSFVTDNHNLTDAGRYLYRFDAREQTDTPIRLPITPSDAPFRPVDAIYLPPKYDGRSLVVAEWSGISVLQSRDGKWQTAKYLGFVPNDPDITASGAEVTAIVEVAGSIFMSNEWPPDPIVDGTFAGNRTSFLSWISRNRLTSWWRGTAVNDLTSEDGWSRIVFEFLCACYRWELQSDRGYGHSVLSYNCV